MIVTHVPVNIVKVSNLVKYFLLCYMISVITFTLLIGVFFIRVTLLFHIKGYKTGAAVKRAFGVSSPRDEYRVALDTTTCEQLWLSSG